MDTLTIAIEDRSMTSVIRKMLGAMRGVAIITPEQDAQLAAPAHREYHISPRIKAMETGFSLPAGISDDYKKELHDIRAQRYS